MGPNTVEILMTCLGGLGAAVVALWNQSRRHNAFVLQKLEECETDREKLRNEQNNQHVEIVALTAEVKAMKDALGGRDANSQ